MKITIRLVVSLVLMVALTACMRKLLVLLNTMVLLTLVGSFADRRP